MPSSTPASPSSAPLRRRDASASPEPPHGDGEPGGEGEPEAELPLIDLHPAESDMQLDILSGLRSRPKTLPCKYFYDEKGSALFDDICELDEYYPTRTETGILERRAP